MAHQRLPPMALELFRCIIVYDAICSFSLDSQMSVGIPSEEGLSRPFFGQRLNLKVLGREALTRM